MISALALIIFTFTIVLHIGVVCQVFIKQRVEDISFSSASLIGVLVVTVITSWASLFFPVSESLRNIILLVLVIITLVKQKNIREVYSKCFHNAKQLSKEALAFYCILLIVTAYAVAAPISLYDSGLYHVQNIKWIQEYAVVPGLGNLHGRFAFNSHFFLPAALFSFSWNGFKLFPLNVVLMIGLLGYLYQQTKLAFQKKYYRLGTTYLVLAIMCLLLYPGWVNSPSPDIASAIVVIFTLVYFVQIRGVFSEWSVLLLVAFSAMAITFKLSNLFLVLLPLIAIIVRYKHVGSLKLVVNPLLTSIIILVPFFIRNVVLSGYLIYPFSSIDLFSFDWQIPNAIVAYEKLHIATWAKIPRATLNDVAAMSIQDWLPIWFFKKSLPFKILLLTSLAGLPAIFIRSGKKYVALALGVVWINLLFWFFNAPDLRFVHGYLMFSSSAGLSIIAVLLLKKTSLLKWVERKYGLLLIGIALISFGAIKADKQELVSSHSILPYSLPLVELRTIQLNNFKALAPKVDTRCWDAALPCVEKPDVPVSMRSGEVKDGFKFQAMNE